MQSLYRLVLLARLHSIVLSATRTWKSDNTAVTVMWSTANRLASIDRGPSVVHLELSAQHFVLPAESNGGHYALVIGNESTACLDWHDSEEKLEGSVNELVSVQKVRRKTSDFSSNTILKGASVRSETTARGYVHNITFWNGTLPVSIRRDICKPILTWGLWADDDQWESGVAPTIDDAAVIPADAGFVEIRGDTRVASLEQSGGTVVTMASTCASGWAKPQGALFQSYANPNRITKCFAPFFGSSGGASGLSFADAEAFCGQVSPGARGHLARIETDVENDVVKELCMGLAEPTEIGILPDAPLGQAHDPGCWVGLSDADGDGNWLWPAEEELTQTGLRSWARGEPNNLTTNIGGEACTLMQPALFDIEAQHEGLWADKRCTSKFPFVCERFGESLPWTLNISGAYMWSGGSLAGGGTVAVYGEATVDGAASHPGLTDGARLELHSTSVWTAPVIEGGDGISIVNRASMTVKSVEFRATAGAGVATLADSRRSLERGGSGILNGSGLPASTFTYSRPTVKITLPVAGGRRPKLINEGTASLFFETSTFSESEVQFFVVNKGLISTTGGKVFLSGGGYGAAGTFAVGPPGAGIVASNYSLVLAVTPTYTLNVSALLEVTDEFSTYSDVDRSFPDRTDSEAPTSGLALSVVQGTYRLEVKHPLTGVSGRTNCIPYHASESHVEAELEALAPVQALGGVTVTRNGDPLSYRWNYGYIYRLVFDASADIVSGGMDESHLQLYCQGSGSDCMCAEVVAKHPVNEEVHYFCRNSSKTDPTVCTLRADVSTMLLHAGGEATMAGVGGALITTGGMHRLPSTFSSAGGGAGAIVNGGVAYVLATNFSIPYLAVTSGALVCAGSSFMGADLAKKLYQDASTDRRETLIHVPFSGFIGGSLKVDGGELRVAAGDFGSGIEASIVWFNGGLLSGWSTITATRGLYVNSSNTKTMRSAMRLTCALNCKGEWAGAGPVVLREGASWFVRGKMTYSVKPFNHESDTSGLDGGVAVSVQWDPFRIGWAEGRQWSGNYWYTNPVCGPHCARAPYLLNTGRILVPNGARPSIGLTLRHLGVCIVADGARLVLDGGGDGGGNWYLGGSLLMSAGRFVMDGDATVSGYGGVNGTIESTSGGPHQTGDKLNTRLVVSGGILEVKTRYYELNDGLQVSGGTVRCSVSGSKIMISGSNLTMTGGEMRFVEVLPNAGIHPTHIHSEKRNADRSFVTVNSKFIWSGGKFRGNAEIGARQGVEIGSREFAEEDQTELMRLEMLCNLVNYGVFYWYWGDIVMKEQANFVNSG